MSIASRFKGRTIFFSYNTYSTTDEKLFTRLMTHLAPLEKEYPDLLWHNSSKVEAGSDIIESITAHMQAAAIIVLLVSPDYLASNHCYTYEMRPALALAEARAARLLPIVLRPIDQGISPLAGYQLLPTNGVPVSRWRHRDDALLEVAKEIRIAIEGLTDLKPSEIDLHSAFVADTSPGRNRLFTDRDTVLERISAAFTSAQHHTTPILALNGLAGMGKTQIAQAYSSRPTQTYESILWLNASSRALLSKEVSRYATHLSLSEDDNNRHEQRLFNAFKRWLQERSSWLLVLDYLEDMTLIDLLIPDHSNGHVLLTTRKQAAGGRAIPITIGSMNIDHAALFLLRRATLLSAEASLDQAPEDMKNKAQAIAQVLGGFPLALDQAGAYIEETGCDLDTYLELYNKQRLWLLGQKKRSVDSHHESVMSTFDLVFQEFARQPDASQDLLHLLAFLHPDAITEKLLSNGAPVLQGALRKLVADPRRRNQAFAALLNFSLLYRGNPDRSILHMHRIVQDVLINKLPMGQRRRWASLAVRLVNHVFPDVRFDTWDECQRHLPHAQHCAMLIDIYKLTMKEGALLLGRLGSYRLKQAAYTEAEAYLKQAHRLYKHHLQTDRLDAARTMNSLALLYAELARYQQAQVLHLQALELQEEAEHSQTTESLHNLAIVYADQGLYQQAERLILRVLALEEHSKDSDHLNVAKALNNLGSVYFDQKRYAEAETAFQNALAIYERTLTANDPDQIYPLAGLGAIAEQQGNLEQAERLYQRTLAISRHAWKEQHPETAHSLNKLADIAESRGDYQQAETGYQQALAIAEEAFESKHPDVALFLNNLAFLAEKQKQYQQAEQYYQRALSIYEQMPELSEHPHMALILNNLARLYRNTQKGERAEPLLRRALAIQRQFLDPTDPDLTLSLNNLADVLIDQQRDTEAAPLLQRALAILLLRTSGPEHPDVEQVRAKYTTLLERLHFNEEIEEVRQLATK
jgi:tetratricopeptide (TPR) repeat protein